MKRLIAVMSFFCFSCDKLVELPDNNSFVTKEAIKSRDELLQSYVSSVYDNLFAILNSGWQITGPTSNISFMLGAMADEYLTARVPSNPIVRNAYGNTYYLNEPGTIPDFFNPLLVAVVECNTVLNGFLYDNPSRYRREIAEVRAIRTILYFYLTQLYAELPLLTSDDVEENFLTGRTDSEVIYEFCINELEEVFGELGSIKQTVNNLETGASYTERINSDVVAYYLSAFYLLSKDYVNSIKYSEIVKDKYTFNADFSGKFLRSSSENIWILNPSLPSETLPSSSNNPNASYLNFRFLGAGVAFNAGSRPFSLAKSLIDDISAQDRRRVHSLDSVMDNGVMRYLPYKYKVGGPYDLNATEHFVLIRLPAIYFNLMEAYIQNGQPVEALALFNEIGAINYENFEPATEITLEDIVQERFKELFAENGDRWFTLKRTGLVDKVMSDYFPLKNNNAEPWDSAKMLYLPIPFEATNLNPNL